MRPFAVLLVGLLSGCPSSSSNSDMGAPGADMSDVGPDVAPTDTGEEPADLGTDSGRDMAADVGPECEYVVETPEVIATPDRIHTPRWAFKPWISKDISDADDTYAFVDGFIDRDIPVGTVVLDSPWETSYNTFVPNPERYPDFGDMVTDMRDREVRVVLWVTQFVNEFSLDFEAGGDTYIGPAPNFAEAITCDFFINDGRRFNWWKGKGGSIDFFNPVARQWWHEQQDALFDMGIAGWKLDFGDSYVRLDEVDTAAGPVAHQAYSEAYYKDFYDYGIHKIGHEDFVTMVRAYDKSYDFEGRFFARPEHAPVVWVGDNLRDWVGLSDALDHMFRSAAAGYTVIGSDLGGYLDRDDADLNRTIPFDRVNFHRWIGMSAMTPFMQLHGRANLTPWSLPNDTNSAESVANYRYWSYVHTELIPFWYSLSEASYAGAVDGIIRPLGDESSWEGDYRYMLGDAFLVAPILDGTGVREIELPAGTYYDWWGEMAPVTGPTTITVDYSADLRRIGLFARGGAIVPLESSTDVSGLTEGGLADADIVLGWPGEPSAFDRYDDGGGTTTFTLSADATGATFGASVTQRTLVVRLMFEDAIASVTVSGAPANPVTDEAGLLTPGSYRRDGDYVWVSAGASRSPVEIKVLR